MIHQQHIAEMTLIILLVARNEVKRVKLVKLVNLIYLKRYSLLVKHLCIPSFITCVQK